MIYKKQVFNYRFSRKKWGVKNNSYLLLLNLQTQPIVAYIKNAYEFPQIKEESIYLKRQILVHEKLKNYTTNCFESNLDKLGIGR